MKREPSKKTTKKKQQKGGEIHRRNKKTRKSQGLLVASKGEKGMSLGGQNGRLRIWLGWS